MLLEEILEKYHIESSDNFKISSFENMIKEAMPGYEITTWDEDESNFGQSVGDTIAVVVKGKQIEDIQTMEWCTDDCCCYMYVVAIKTKEIKMASTINEMFIVRVFEDGELLGYGDHHGFLREKESERCYFENFEEAKEIQSMLITDYPDCMVVVDAVFVDNDNKD